jgi:thiamine-phosphate pyrophosphorylase
VTKDTGYTPVGLAAVNDVSVAARQRGVPTVAIGGITLENAASVIEAGAQSVAVISDLLTTGDPRERTRAYLQRLSRLSVSSRGLTVWRHTRRLVGGRFD